MSAALLPHARPCRLRCLMHLHVRCNGGNVAAAARRRGSLSAHVCACPAALLPSGRAVLAVLAPVRAAPLRPKWASSSLTTKLGGQLPYDQTGRAAPFRSNWQLSSRLLFAVWGIRFGIERPSRCASPRVAPTSAPQKPP
eukprot:354459-Chlamydomonas_euryale.AAC.3